MEEINEDCFELIVYHASDGSFRLGFATPVISDRLTGIEIGQIMTKNAKWVSLTYQDYLDGINEFWWYQHRPIELVEKQRFDSLHAIEALMSTSRTLRSRIMPYWKTIYEQAVRFTLFKRKKYAPCFHPSPATNENYYLALAIMKMIFTTPKPGDMRIYPTRNLRCSNRSWHIVYPSMTLRRGSDPKLLQPLKHGQMLLRISNAKYWRAKPKPVFKKTVETQVARLLQRKARVKQLLGKH